jgi:DNA topoisomerase-1
VEIGAEGAVGLITYMRTDSFNISKDAQDEALAFIRETIGPDYAPATPNLYKSKKDSQGAHEAVRRRRRDARRKACGCTWIMTNFAFIN